MTGRTRLGWVLLLLFAAGATPLYGAETQSVPAPRALRDAFETADGKVWSIAATDSQGSRTLAAQAGELWDFRGVRSLSAKAERANSAGGSTRLRWLVTSRVGGLYLGPAVPLPLSGVALPAIDFSPEACDLTPVGHQRPWDALAAAEVSALELRAEYTPGVMKTGGPGALAIGVSNVHFDLKKSAATRAEVLDLRIRSTGSPQHPRYVLSFRINPLPLDPYAASGDGDVRVRIGAQQTLAFLDQDLVEIDDGAAVRLAPVGLPVWRAYFSEWPASGRFEIVSGQNAWPVPFSAVEMETLSAPAKPEKNRYPSTDFDTKEQPKRRARARWEIPLEATVPAMDASWTGRSAHWGLSSAGAWLPLSETQLLGAYKLPLSAVTADAAAQKVWRPVPFWDESWGGYAGARRPDYALARQMDAELEAAAKRGEARPLVLFDGASLERQGVFNWASHPLRAKLAGPGELFRTEAGFDFCARWMRYCFARYAQSSAVSALLITTDLNAPGASEFHARLAPLLREWRSGVAPNKAIIAFHPLTQPPQVVKEIGTFEADNREQDANWHVDRRVERTIGRAIDRFGLGGGRCYELLASDASATSIAVQNTYSLEYSDWRKPADDNFFACNALLFEVWTPPDAPHDLRVGVHLRDRNGNCFQTLLPGMLRPGDWTTCALDLTAANAHGLLPINHRTAWTDYSRQRLQEIGLHVYSTHPRFTLKTGRVQNLTARFDNIRGVVFPQTAPEPKTQITLVDLATQVSGTPSSKPAPAMRGSLVEYHVKVNKAFANPFDARDCDLSAVITTPSGKTARVPAFFDQLCERREATPGGDEIVEPVGGEFFTVRYRAQENGPHALRFELRERGRYDVARKWIPDDRFTPQGEGQAATERHWPFPDYPRGLNEDGRRPVDKVTFVPGTLTAMLDLGPVAFTVVESSTPFHGFVRVAKDKRHFEFDDGSFYFPIGPCLRSPSDTRIPYRSPKYAREIIDALGKRGTYQYDEYFNAFGKAGINWARVWMCSWWGALEWRRDWPGYQGLGRYNLANAWRMDYVVALAEKNNIHMNVAVTNHGQFTLDIDSEWANNPYNAALGGPLTAPCEMFTRGEAKINHQNKLRYVAARYGHSPAVMAFALFSELEFTEEYERSLHLDERHRHFLTDHPAPSIESWHSEMAAFLKSVDPNRHLVTTHFSHPERGEGTLAVPEIDIATSNAYSAFDNLAHGGMDASAALHDFWLGNDDGTIKGFHIFDKPGLVEEQGRHWMGMDAGRETNTKSELDADLHAGLWGSVVLPLSGATGYWWWLHVHFENRYGDYRALAKFMEGEDFRPLADEAPLKPVFRSLPKSPLLGRAMKSDRRMFAWIYHELTPYGDQQPETVEHAVMNIGGLRPGKYRVEFWDTYKGEKISAMDLDYPPDKSGVEIKLPPVARDIAMKIKPVP